MPDVENNKCDMEEAGWGSRPALRRAAATGWPVSRTGACGSRGYGGSGGSIRDALAPGRVFRFEGAPTAAGHRARLNGTTRSRVLSRQAGRTAQWTITGRR